MKIIGITGGVGSGKSEILNILKNPLIMSIRTKFKEYFAKLRELSVDISAKNIDNVNMRDLSMGMTGDYQVAVQEGSTMVRVGTGIFGERNYATRQED